MIFIEQDDEYYGSQLGEVYDGLHDAYAAAGKSNDETEALLQIQTPDKEWFARRGVTGNYHGGGNVVFEEASVLNWVISHSK